MPFTTSDLVCPVMFCRKTADVRCVHRGVEMFHACVRHAEELDRDRWTDWIVLLDREYLTIKREAR